MDNTKTLTDDQKIATMQTCDLLAKKLGCTQKEAMDKLLKVLGGLTNEG